MVSVLSYLGKEKECSKNFKEFLTKEIDTFPGFEEQEKQEFKELLNKYFNGTLSNSEEKTKLRTYISSIYRHLEELERKNKSNEEVSDTRMLKSGNEPFFTYTQAPVNKKDYTFLDELKKLEISITSLVSAIKTTVDMKLLGNMYFRKMKELTNGQKIYAILGDNLREEYVVLDKDDLNNIDTHIKIDSYKIEEKLGVIKLTKNGKQGFLSLNEKITNKKIEEALKYYQLKIIKIGPKSEVYIKGTMLKSNRISINTKWFVLSLKDFLEKGVNEEDLKYSPNVRVVEEKVGEYKIVDGK